MSKTIKMLAAVQGSSTSFRGFSLFELELLARITSVFRCEKNQKVRPAHPTQLYHRHVPSRSFLHHATKFEAYDCPPPLL